MVTAMVSPSCSVRFLWNCSCSAVCAPSAPAPIAFASKRVCVPGEGLRFGLASGSGFGFELGVRVRVRSACACRTGRCGRVRGRGHPSRPRAGRRQRGATWRPG
eukprot:scaffold46988_cov58-Phaeocystis_antarctica.AAC.2